MQKGNDYEQKKGKMIERYRKGSHALLKKYSTWVWGWNMVVHATVYYNGLYEKRSTTKDPSPRDQQQGKCVHNIALSTKQN